MTLTLDSAAPTFARRRGARTLIAAAAGLALGAAGIAPAAQAAPAAGWTADVTTLSTGVSNGYQLAFDASNRKVYFSDAQWAIQTRTVIHAQDGVTPVGGILNPVVAPGKLVERDRRPPDPC